MKRNILNASVFILCTLAVLWSLFEKGMFKKYPYGKSANAIREQVKIPIIGSDMKKITASTKVSGGRWEAKTAEAGIVHLWKNVIPHSGNGDFILDEEMDSFKKDQDGKTYWQLNIISKVIGDSIALRRGNLTLRDESGTGQQEFNLDENGLDSIFREWRLTSLVKGQ
jgi:hypothetical protein